MAKPMLTVLVCTYNHELYIAQCLDSILAQKTSFTVSVKIMEDCSTDGTLAICKDYAARYPDRIKLFAQPENTKARYLLDVLRNELDGEYWAYIDGDDYLYDENFYQKAVDALEADKTKPAYFANGLYLYQGKPLDTNDVIVSKEACSNDTLSIKKSFYTHVSGRVNRNMVDFKTLPYPSDQELFIADELVWFYLFLTKGDAIFDSTPSSVYRINPKGIWSGRSDEEKQTLSRKMFGELADYFGGEYRKYLINYVGIMQPYFFPYLGYWQLIAASRTWVVYDNIQYTKKGWFNRNRFCENGTDSLFSIPLAKDSDYLDVRERKIAPTYDRKKLVARLANTYRKAPYFKEHFPIIEEIINFGTDNLFDYIYNSIVKMVEFLGIDTEIIISSNLPIDSNLKGADKVKAITKQFWLPTYINAIGGQELYDKADFASAGIDLKFIKMDEIKYKQFGDDFISNLSIIDVMMFNSREEIGKMLKRYELV